MVWYFWKIRHNDFTNHFPEYRNHRIHSYLEGRMAKIIFNCIIYIYWHWCHLPLYCPASQDPSAKDQKALVISVIVNFWVWMNSLSSLVILFQVGQLKNTVPPAPETRQELPPRKITIRNMIIFYCENCLIITIFVFMPWWDPFKIHSKPQIHYIKCHMLLQTLVVSSKNSRVCNACL